MPRVLHRFSALVACLVAGPAWGLTWYVPDEAGRDEVEQALTRLWPGGEHTVQVGLAAEDVDAVWFDGTGVVWIRDGRREEEPVTAATDAVALVRSWERALPQPEHGWVPPEPTPPPVLPEAPEPSPEPTPPPFDPALWLGVGVRGSTTFVDGPRIVGLVALGGRHSVEVSSYLSAGNVAKLYSYDVGFVNEAGEQSIGSFIDAWTLGAAWNTAVFDRDERSPGVVVVPRLTAGLELRGTVVRKTELTQEGSAPALGAIPTEDRGVDFGPVFGGGFDVHLGVAEPWRRVVLRAGLLDRVRLRADPDKDYPVDNPRHEPTLSVDLLISL